MTVPVWQAENRSGDLNTSAEASKCSAMAPARTLSPTTPGRLPAARHGWINSIRRSGWSSNCSSTMASLLWGDAGCAFRGKGLGSRIGLC